MIQLDTLTHTLSYDNVRVVVVVAKKVHISHTNVARIVKYHDLATMFSSLTHT